MGDSLINKIIIMLNKMKVDFRHADVSSVANVGGEDFRLNK